MRTNARGTGGGLDSGVCAAGRWSGAMGEAGCLAGCPRVAGRDQGGTAGVACAPTRVTGRVSPDRAPHHRSPSCGPLRQGWHHHCRDHGDTIGHSKGEGGWPMDAGRTRGGGPPMLRSSGAGARRPRLPAILAALALILSACVPTLPRRRPVAFSMKDGRLAMVVNACPGWAPFEAKITEEGRTGIWAGHPWTSSEYRSSQFRDTSRQDRLGSSEREVRSAEKPDG